MTRLAKPEWLKIKPNLEIDSLKIKKTLKKNNLNTVCEEANCPNIFECWREHKTATFMILGDTCTRACKFCNIKTSNKGKTINKKEPDFLAKAIKEANIKYVVLTSVDRDDLIDGGANHFSECIKKIKQQNVLVEVLIPDFFGKEELIKIITNSEPNVIGHNVETVKELQKQVRDPRANYETSLNVLKTIKTLNNKILTKSSIMLGLGETKEQVINTMKDLRRANCDFLTIGQYLQPSKKNIEVKKYVPLEDFEFFKKKAEELGFKKVESGPFIRTSYNAKQIYTETKKEKKSKNAN